MLNATIDFLTSLVSSSDLHWEMQPTRNINKMGENTVCLSMEAALKTLFSGLACTTHPGLWVWTLSVAGQCMRSPTQLWPHFLSHAQCWLPNSSTETIYDLPSQRATVPFTHTSWDGLHPVSEPQGPLRPAQLQCCPWC